MTPMIILVVLLSLPILLILYFQNHKTKPSRKNRPPGPRGLPFIGNLHQFDGKNPHKYLYTLSKQYGPIMSMKLGFRKVLVISSANTVKEIMKSHDFAFSGRPVLVSLQRLSYNCLDVAFSTYNATWREMRKISTLHLFSLKQVQSFHPICKDEVSRMIKKISKDASMSRITNLSEVMISFTSNTICRVAFGKDYGAEGYERNRFFHLLHEAQAMLGGFFVGDYLPSFAWVDKINGMARRLEKNFNDLDSFYQELIQEHLDPNRPTSMDEDILGLLLGIRRDGSSSIDITLDHIKALLMNIISGGVDPSSVVPIWAMTALIKNPSIMKKVQAEIREFAKNKKKDLIDEDDIANLPYLRAVIKETFRLYPPAPLLAPRETMQKCTIDGYEIEAGTLVYINAWSIGRDSEIWENPNEFSPDRFLGSEVDVRGRDPELIPFGIGRRGCPAISIGMAKVEICLANLLNAFDWELPYGMKGEDVTFDALPGMAMHKKSALRAVAKPHVNGY
ncbi:hypothetical protein ABFS83_04G164800 [Erythranthe nasuta]